MDNRDYFFVHQIDKLDRVSYQLPRPTSIPDKQRTKGRDNRYLAEQLTALLQHDTPVSSISIDPDNVNMLIVAFNGSKISYPVSPAKTLFDLYAEIHEDIAKRGR